MNFQNNQVFKTVFGGIITLIILILFLFGCWFFGQELVYKQNPAVISSQRSVVQAKRIDILSDSLIAMIGVSNGASQIWNDPTIFTVRIVQEILSISIDAKTGKVIRKLVDFEKQAKICDIGDVGIPELVPYYNKLDLSVLFCFKSGQELYMEGDFDADRFAQVFVYIDKCQNSTSSTIICQPPDVIDAKLKLTKVQIFMSDKIIDPTNLNSPFAEKGMNLYSSTSSSFPKELQLYFTNQYIQDDVGFLYKQQQEKHTFVFTDIKETTFFSDPNVLARVLFRIQKQKENLMQRRYQKFADIVAQVGGILKILTTVGTLITYPITRLYLYKEVGDQLFNFNIDKHSEKHQQLKGQSKKKQGRNVEQKYQIKNSSHNKVDFQPEKNRNFNQKNYSNMNGEVFSKEKISNNKQQSETNIKSFDNLKQNKLRQLLEKSQAYFQITHDTIKYTFNDYIKQLFSSLYKKYNFSQKLIKQGIQQIENQLDVLFIIQKLHEIDKLKTVLLNPDQLKLFDFIPKPIISNDSEQDGTQKLKEQQKSENSTNRQSGINHQNHINSLIKNSQQVYSINKAQKSEQGKSREAYEGLQNILKKEQQSKIDQKLIELIEPLVIYQNSILNVSSDKLEKDACYEDSIYENVNKDAQTQNYQINSECEQQRIIPKTQLLMLNELKEPNFNFNMQKKEDTEQQIETIRSLTSDRNQFIAKKSCFSPESPIQLSKSQEFDIQAEQLSLSQQIIQDDLMISYNPSQNLEFKVLGKITDKQTSQKDNESFKAVESNVIKLKK